MAAIDRHAPLAFLRAGYAPDDWVAVLVKSSRTGHALQRVLPVATVAGDRFQAWLRAKNAHRWDVYVSTNALTPGQRSRTREHVANVRHVLVDADAGGQGVLAALAEREDIPPPTFVLRTSPRRVHVLWRVKGFDVPQVEALQKHLARELGTDTAATSAAQLTRLPGFVNHKSDEPFTVALQFRAASHARGVSDFPRFRRPPEVTPVGPVPHGTETTLSRVRAYLWSMPPAVAGERGDAHTFRVCCRVVRGFALSEADALVALAEWNQRCVPPWSTEELAAKIRNARRYGREPFGVDRGPSRS